MPSLRYIQGEPSDGTTGTVVQVGDCTGKTQTMVVYSTTGQLNNFRRKNNMAAKPGKKSNPGPQPFPPFKGKACKKCGKAPCKCK
jgi:hypothetical protein